MTKPPGWPAALPDPDHGDFPVRAVIWLFDACPPDYRGHEVFRRHPVVLARLANYHAAASLAAAREAYSGARRELAGVVTPEAVEETLIALANEGANLSRIVREVALVEDALSGRRWRERL